MIMQKNSLVTRGKLLLLLTLIGLLFSTSCGQPESYTGSDTTATPNADVPEVPAQKVNVDDALQPYLAELADHRLFEFSRYNSGSNGEGMRKEEWADLCSGGRYFSYSSSTISVGDHLSQDNHEDQGTWQVYNKEGSVVVRFKSDAGVEREVPVIVEDGKLYLNGKRYYHIPKGEENGPQSCN
jgi:hypothetical protein